MARYFSTHFGTYKVTGKTAAKTLSPLADDPAPARFGLNYLELASHPSRITRPMARRGWLAGDTPSTRGADDFVALSWDRAIELAAHEIERIRSRHGNTAIYAGSYGWASAGRFHHAQSQLKRLLNLCGGFTSSCHSYSYGTASAFLPHVLGPAFADTNASAPSWDQIARHTDCMLAFGLRMSNTQCDSGGVGHHTVGNWLHTALERGMRLIVISADRSDTPDHPGAEHLAIRPNTDTALLLAIAFVLINRGQTDPAQLARLTVGFDALSDYILGRTDGIPKTPAWAADISGATESAIIALADAVTAPTALLSLGWSLQRASGGEQPYWMAIALAAIAGQIGRPGGGFAFGLGSVNSVGQPVRQLQAPGLPQGRNPVSDFIPVACISELLERPGEPLDYNGTTITLPDIRLVYWAGGNPFHHHQDLNRLRRAWQRPETVIVHEPVWTATACHADLVLPTTLPFERDDIVVSKHGRTIVMNRALRAPHGQARNDHAICAAIAERLGLEPAFTEGRDIDGWLRHLYAGYVERFPELPDYDRFQALGQTTLDADEPAPQPHVLLGDFAANPTRHPLETPSGRIELFSATIASFGYTDCPAHPTWLPPAEYLGAPRAKQFPLHLLTPQPTNRLHSQLDTVGESKRHKVQGHEVATFARVDAAARGIRSGDTVRLHNDRGACLVSAALSETLMPGVVVLPTGAWYTPADPNDPQALEIAGNPNVLTHDTRASRLSQGCAVHSCLIEATRHTEAG